MSSRGLASSVRRCLPVDDAARRRRWRAPRARRGAGSTTTPAPASDAARSAGRRRRRTMTSSTARPSPGAPRRRVEDEEPRRRRDGDERRARRRPPSRSAAARGALARRRRPAGARRSARSRRGACAASVAVATAPSPASVMRSFRRACRASSHDWRMAQAAASSMCARAFFPRTSLAASARCACTVVRRSSHSSTSRPVASATAAPGAGRPARAAFPSPAVHVERQPDDEAPHVLARPPEPRSAVGQRPAVAPVEGAARMRHQAELVVDGHADARARPGRARRRRPARPSGHRGSIAQRSRGERISAADAL